MPMPPQQGPRGNKKAGTFSARGKGSRGAPPFMMYGPGMGPPPPHMMGPPPHLLPPPGHPLYAHHGPMPFQMGGGREGHINERAFAHSMKNEHRSRSFGSLANLQFDPNGEVLDGMEGSPEMMNGRKKEHEMHQMIGQMDGMDLDDDQIERREVPAGFVPQPLRYRGPPSGPPGPPMVAMGGPGPDRRRR